ncbi:MAG: hypothetical protein F4089_02560 [Gammaproteobacteria bacterium]|nr:hypothetical protein [Gammaproteobacteria bacterium]
MMRAKTALRRRNDAVWFAGRGSTAAGWRGCSRTRTQAVRPSRIRWLAVAAVAALALAATSATTKTLRIATAAPDGSTWMKVLRAGGGDLEAATGGRLDIKFYPGGVRGDDHQVMRRIRIGQLDGGIVQTGTVGRLFTDVQIYNLPMVFRNLDEVDLVRQTMDPMLTESMAAAGFVSLGIAELGMAYPMSTKEARSLADARELKVWTPQGDEPALRTLAAYGIAPIALPLGEVYPGLATNLIDTVAAPPVAVLPLLWHTKLKYVIDVPFMYIYSLVFVAAPSLAGVADGDVVLLKRVMGEAGAEVDRRNRADHEAARQALLTQGLRFLRPNDDQIEQWRDASRRVRQAWVEERLRERGHACHARRPSPQGKVGRGGRTGGAAASADAIVTPYPRGNPFFAPAQAALALSPTFSATGEQSDRLLAMLSSIRRERCKRQVQFAEP